MIGLLTLAAAAAAQPQPAVTIPPRHVLVEGVATDGRTIWASSVLDRTIVACGKICRGWITLPPGLHPLGLAWHKDRLWVAADCPPLPGVGKCERGALLGYNRGGRLMTRVAPREGAFHPGDVSASPAGVFVADSLSGAVYNLATNRGSLSPVIAVGVGRSAQGTAVDAEGKKLLVADYGRGFAWVDLASRARTLLPGPDGKPYRGVDGLTRCGSTYYGIFNGEPPGYLISVTPTDQGVAVERPLGTLTFPDPTQLVFDGKQLLIVSNAGWEAAGKAGAVRAAGATIVSIPLGEDCKPR